MVLNSMETSGTKTPEQSIKIFLNRLFELFEQEKISYAVARNYHSLPDSLDGRDLDVQIDSHDIPRAFEIVKEIAESLSAKVMRIKAENGFWVVVAYCGSPFWGLKIDMLSPRGVEWRGCYFLNPGKTIDNRIKRDGYYCLDYDDIMFMQFCRDITGRLCLRKKYHEKISTLFNKDPQEFEVRLQRIYGRKYASKLEQVCQKGEYEGLASLGKKLRRQIIIRSFLQRPLSSMLGMSRYFIWRCREYVKPNGITVAVEGPDGSGKGTLIEKVSKEFSKVLHLTMNLNHLRPDFLPSLNSALNKGERNTAPVADPHARKQRGFVLSLIHIAYYTIDYCLGYWLRIRPCLGRKNIAAIFDRYFYDYYIDNYRFRITLPRWVIKFFGLFIHKPNLVIFLSADAEAVRRRKPELPIPEIRRQMNEMEKLANSLHNAVWVNTSVSIEDSCNDFIRQIIKVLEKRLS